MLEIIAIAMIAVGIFLVIRGFTERLEFGYEELEFRELEEQKDWEDWEEYKWRKREEMERMRKPEKPKRDIKAGGVVLIGPIPIVFGDSKYASLALILAIILMVLSLIYIFSIQAVV
mgnify:CR=1 FL=1|jgi:uncharacterized protein (TIGR00304 family)